MPSAYFLTDAFLYLDLLLKKKLFKSESPVTRADMAGKEGVKAKRMLGALRTLWRSSPAGGHDARIAELKKYLKASPRRVPCLALSCNPSWVQL